MIRLLYNEGFHYVIIVLTLLCMIFYAMNFALEHDAMLIASRENFCKSHDAVYAYDLRICIKNDFVIALPKM